MSPMPFIDQVVGTISVLTGENNLIGKKIFSSIDISKENIYQENY